MRHGFRMLVAVFCVIGLGALLAADASAGMPAPKDQYLSMATSSAGGTLFPLGGAMAAIIKKQVPQIKINPEVTGGSVDNIKLLMNKKVELALSSSQPCYEGFMGIGKFKETGKITNYSALASGHQIIFQLYTLKKNKINSIRDLKGKRISLGASGSDGNVVGKIILEAHGLKMSQDWKPEYLSHGDGPGALRDGRVDAVLIVSPTPTSAVTDITSTHAGDVVFLLPEPQILAAVLKEHPYWSKSIIPGGVYRGHPNTYQGSFGMATYFVARNDVDNATAYWIIKTVLENNADLGRANALGKFWTKEIALEPVKGVIPIHPGAEAYFKEIGIWK